VDSVFDFLTEKWKVKMTIFYLIWRGRPGLVFANQTLKMMSSFLQFWWHENVGLLFESKTTKILRDFGQKKQKSGTLAITFVWGQERLQVHDYKVKSVNSIQINSIFKLKTVLGHFGRKKVQLYFDGNNNFFTDFFLNVDNCFSGWWIFMTKKVGTFGTRYFCFKNNFCSKKWIFNYF
jgi:hypothetical protein